MKFSFKKSAIGVLASMMLAGAANAGELLVYSSTDADNLKYYTMMKSCVRDTCIFI